MTHIDAESNRSQIVCTMVH